VLTVCLPTGSARLSKRNRGNGRGLKLIINKLTVKDASGRHQKLHLGLVELAALLTCCVEVGGELPSSQWNPCGQQACSSDVPQSGTDQQVWLGSCR
jgi:hypothetical protein